MLQRQLDGLVKINRARRRRVCFLPERTYLSQKYDGHNKHWSDSHGLFSCFVVAPLLEHRQLTEIQGRLAQQRDHQHHGYARPGNQMKRINERQAVSLQAELAVDDAQSTAGSRCNSTRLSPQARCQAF